MDTPFWLDESTPPVLDGVSPQRVDVAVIGAGITGVSCALGLARAGLKVRVHDARGIAEGASGRNGGFALRGGGARYDVARGTYGAAAAKELWQRAEQGLDRPPGAAGGGLPRNGGPRPAA